MNKEKAQDYIGKTVYIVNYQDKLITPYEVGSYSVDKTNTEDIVQLVSVNGSNLWGYKENMVDAYSALLDYYETRLNWANKEYQEALKLVGLVGEPVGSLNTSVTDSCGNKGCGFNKEGTCTAEGTECFGFVNTKEK